MYLVQTLHYGYALLFVYNQKYQKLWLSLCVFVLCVTWWFERGQNILKCSENRYWKRFVGRRWRFDEKSPLHLRCVRQSQKLKVKSLVKSLVSQLFKATYRTAFVGCVEMIIAENGPLLQHADAILERAINNHWKKTVMVNDTSCTKLTIFGLTREVPVKSWKG